MVAAVAVAGDDGFGQGGGDGAGGAADVEGLAWPGGDDPADVGVFGEAAGVIAGDDGA